MSAVLDTIAPFMNPVYQTIMNGSRFSVSEAQFNEITKGLQDEMRKSASIGYQTGPGMDANANYSPLLLQSIDDRLADTTTYGVEDFVFFNLLPQDQATQTMHEIRTKIRKGNRFLSLAAGEGEAGTVDDSKYGEGTVKMKYWVTKRQLSYQAQNAPGAAWVESSALTLETDNSMVQLRRALEIDSIWGDSSIDPNEVDGVTTQLDLAGIGEDLGGKQLTFNAITRRLAKMSKVDVGGHPTALLVGPDLWADLEIQAISDGAAMRYTDGNGTTVKSREFTYGATGFEVFVPGSKKKIEIIKVPFLDLASAYSTPFEEDGTTLVAAMDPEAKGPASPTVSSGPTAATASGSGFTVALSGTYKYWILARNKKGTSAAIATSTVGVASGDGVTILLDVPVSNLPVDYLVFRSDNTASDESAKFLFRTKYNTAGAGPKVKIFDKNQVRANASRALLLNLKNKDELAFYRFLPLARVPLPMVEFQIPFALFMSGAPRVKVPRKQWQWVNVGVSDPT